MVKLEPSDKTRTDKRNSIIEAAVTVFAQKGYASATVAEIAARANIGKGTIYEYLYEYFVSKEDLFCRGVKRPSIPRSVRRCH
jgi:AcrR family transcriptional regulator